MIKETEELAAALKKTVLRNMDMSEDIEDKQVSRIIDECILSSEELKGTGLNEKLIIKRSLFNSLRRLDVLSEMLEDDNITEIMINGYNKIFVEEKGRIRMLQQSFEDEERLNSVIQQIVAGCNRIVNESTPIVDARLKDGSRVNIVLPPVSLNGATMTIRKFPKRIMDMDTLIGLDAISEQVADFLKALVKSGYNMFISGGTGAGKTTFLNALSGYIPPDERVITIEDSAELQLIGIDNLVRLEARNANVSGTNSITIRELIKTSLRMRPDRIIVGEVRDAAAIDMLSAMNTGHDGSLSTGHANSAADMLTRLESMVLMGIDIPLRAVRQQIASAVDIIIHLGRMRDKSRKVLEISEVLGMDNEQIQLNVLFKFEETGEISGKVKGHLRKINDLHNVGKLKATGLIDVIREK
jgi:pilus assembly protein CpaF